MAQVLDYSAGFPGARAIRDAGYAGAVRYIGTPGNPKCTTRAELADFTAHGLGMALVFEQYATDWRGGYQAGKANMRRSLDHAYAVGWPADRRPIYMAVDQDVVTPAEFDAAMDYLTGAADAHKGKALTGPYGEHDVCARSAEAGFAWQWQCRAWSGTPPRLFAGRRLYQEVATVRVGGIDCDVNQVLQPDWGQHNATPQKRGTRMDILIKVPGTDPIYVFSADAVGCGVRQLAYVEALALAKNPAYKDAHEVSAEELADLIEQSKKTPIGPGSVWNYEIPERVDDAGAVVGGKFTVAHLLPGRTLEAVGEVQAPAAPVIDYARFAEAVKPLIGAVVESAVEDVMSRTGLSVKEG